MNWPGGTTCTEAFAAGAVGPRLSDAAGHMTHFIKDNPVRYERIKSTVRDFVPMPKAFKQAMARRAGRWHQQNVQDFVFIHINKCGGTSLERGLGIPFLNHDTAAERLAVLGPEEFQRRFRFTLVRNPYDRYISKYFYDDKSGRSYEELLRAFPDWLDQMEEENRNGTATRHRRTMKWWLTGEDGTLLVDHFYKLEELDKGLAEISERLGRKVEMKRIKSSPVTHDKNDILGSAELRQRLHALLAEDFEHFGYAP